MKTEDRQMCSGFSQVDNLGMISGLHEVSFGENSEGVKNLEPDFGSAL